MRINKYNRMSGRDTLVIEISQKQVENDSTMIYIFYDYRRLRFGVRVGKVDLTNFFELEENDLEQCVNGHYSYYTRDDETLYNFIFNVIGRDNIDEICLVNYWNLPRNTDDIKFTTLLRNHVGRENEILDYLSPSYNPRVNVKGKLTSFVKIIQEIYNEY